MKPRISKRGAQWVCILRIPGRTPVICYGDTPASAYRLWLLSKQNTDLPVPTREAWYN